MSERYIAAICPHGLTTAGGGYDTDHDGEEEKVRSYFEGDSRSVVEVSEPPTIELCRTCLDLRRTTEAADA